MLSADVVYRHCLGSSGIIQRSMNSSLMTAPLSIFTPLQRIVIDYSEVTLVILQTALWVILILLYGVMN